MADALSFLIQDLCLNPTQRQICLVQVQASGLNVSPELNKVPGGERQVICQKLSIVLTQEYVLIRDIKLFLMTLYIQPCEYVQTNIFHDF